MVGSKLASQGVEPSFLLRCVQCGGILEACLHCAELHMEADEAWDAAVETAALAERLSRPGLRGRAVGCALRKATASAEKAAGLAALCQVLSRAELESAVAGNGGLGLGDRVELALTWATTHLGKPQQQRERDDLLESAIPWGQLSPQQLRELLLRLESLPLFFTPHLMRCVAVAALGLLGAA